MGTQHQNTLSVHMLDRITQLHNHTNTNTHTHAHHANPSPSSHWGAHMSISALSHTGIRSSSHCSSLFPWLSTLVQVGRLGSAGRRNLSPPLTIIVWQQPYRVKHDFTSSRRPQRGVIDLLGTVEASGWEKGNCNPLQIRH